MTTPSERKTIATTLGALADSHTALVAVLALPVDAKTAYHISKLARLVTPDIRSFHEQRDKIVQKFGVPVEGSEGQFVIPPDKTADFRREEKDLLEVPVTIDFAPITLAMLDGQKVEGRHLIGLGALLAENAD